jgi:hypothetical protein
MADITSTFASLSSTESSNAPTGATAVGTGLDDNLRMAQAHIAAFRDASGWGGLTLSSISGTNTVTGSVAAAGSITMAPTAYATGMKFVFVPAATNTGATTLNVNSLGAKNIFFCGAACSGGEIVQNVPCHVVYDGTQFNILGPLVGTRKTNSIGADVNLNNTGSYFDGPSVAQGTAGVWLATGTVTVIDTSGSADFDVKLWDGTTVIASAQTQTGAASEKITVSLSGYIASPAGNIRISVKDKSSTSGLIKFNLSGNSKDSTISAIRIA